jgi:tRNA modification GTPase
VSRNGVRQGGRRDEVGSPSSDAHLEFCELSDPQQTIFAPASGVGRAAIAVIRISGVYADRALAAMLSGSLPLARRASLRSLYMPGSRELLDRALVVRFPERSSYTGEDMVELHVTGSRAVAAAVLGVLASIDGLRPAEPGEFALRAFENGKLDLSQVEGLADLVNAQTQAQRRQALRLADGALGAWTAEIRERLISVQTWLEAAIDFSDQDDVTPDVIIHSQQEVGALAEQIQSALLFAGRAERLKDGVTVVIAGSPNVGKSTLINALAKRNVSIVSATPGTTRDAVEATFEMCGFPVTVIDTAGIRETFDPIESEGVTIAEQRMAAADMVLWLFEGSAEGVCPLRVDGKVLRVQSKCDTVGTKVSADVISVSAHTGEGLDALFAAIENFAVGELSGAESALITNERHRRMFSECLACLQRFCAHQLRTPQIELMAEDLRAAARSLGRIAGRLDNEEILGSIFARLCIGK